MANIQRRNAQRRDTATPDLLPNDYRFWHEPFGDFGVWNGQFEVGGDPYPEGWYWGLYAGGSIDRVTGGLAGNWCMRGGQVGTGQGGALYNLRLFAVDEDRDYYVSGAFKGSSAAATVYLGLVCYDSVKAFIAYRYVLSAVAPGVAWIRYQRRIGPNGDAAFAANTRYVRVIAILQFDITQTNTWAYVDDVQFQQLKASYSSGITFLDDRVRDSTLRTFDKQAWTLYPGSTMNITLEEESYFWIWYRASFYADTVRTLSYHTILFIDGAAVGASTYSGQGMINEYQPVSLSNRSVNSYTRGAHTLEMRVYVLNAGDTVTGIELNGCAFAIRRY